VTSALTVSDGTDLTSSWPDTPPGADPLPGQLDRWLASRGAELVAIRRHIHAHPELSHAEFETAALVARELAVAGLAPKLLPKGNGVICDIGEGEPVVAFRADLDALPLPDSKDVPYRSTVDKIAHACGHDVHTTVLLGLGWALAQLNERGELPGRVRLIFQPAEEAVPSGAPEVIATGALKDVGSIYALHCYPQLPAGLVGVRSGPFTAAADTVRVTLTGPGGHTARPHLTADLVEALGLLITQLPLLLSRQVDPRSGTVLVWGAVHAGEAANAIPQHGVLRGTLRTADHATWGELEEIMRELVAPLLAPLGVGYSLEHMRGVPPVVNEHDSTGMLVDAATMVLGPDAAASTEQSSGGEDFAWYLEHVPGAMARLGVWSGDGPMRDIHQPSFDIDERAIPFGVRILARTALIALDS
jgi:amidohydrolase